MATWVDMHASIGEAWEVGDECHRKGPLYSTDNGVGLDGWWEELEEGLQTVIDACRRTAKNAYSVGIDVEVISFGIGDFFVDGKVDGVLGTLEDGEFEPCGTTKGLRYDLCHWD
jgi:hypothetical protein